MLGYINPQLAAVLAAQAGKLPVPPPQVDQAPVAEPIQPPAALPVPPQADSTNDGINSVGRPADNSAAHDKELRKLQRQGKGEALMALGAQLLSSRTFGEGISKGMLAYVQSLNAARTRNRPKHEDAADGAFDKVTDPVTGEVTFNRTPVADYKDAQFKIVQDNKLHLGQLGYDGKVDTAAITANAGIEKTGMTTGSNERIAGMNIKSREHIAEINNVSDETVARIAASARVQGRALNKLEIAAAERARTAPQEIDLYDRVQTLVDGGHSGAGAGLWNKTKRAIVEATGADFGGVKVQDQQLLNQNLRSIELKAAQALQGQGQVSDAERRILQESTPSMSTDPQAMKQVLDVLRKVAYRNLSGGGLPTPTAPSSATPSKEDLKKKYGLK